MKIKDLINQLKNIKDQEREISIVLGNEGNVSLTFDSFEVHNADDNETSVELFCFDNYMFEQDYCYSIRDFKFK